MTKRSQGEQFNFFVISGLELRGVLVESNFDNSRVY